MSHEIGIKLSPEEASFLRSCLVEVWGGGSVKEISRIFNRDKTIAQNIHKQLKQPSESYQFSDTDWRIIYDAVNATIYGLGANELQIITGNSLIEAVNTNQKIASVVWGCYGGCLWEKSNA